MRRMGHHGPGLTFRAFAWFASYLLLNRLTERRSQRTALTPASRRTQAGRAWLTKPDLIALLTGPLSGSEPAVAST